MDILLLRMYLSETYTIGRLYIDGVYFCDTLEDKVRDLKDLNKDNDFDDNGEGKIYAQTAIPYGKYKVTITHSPKLKRRLPLIIDVPGFSGIRIHAGKNKEWTAGCVLVGENKIKGGLINSEHYEDEIIKRIDEAILVNKEITITIKK